VQVDEIRISSANAAYSRFMQTYSSSNGAVGSAETLLLLKHIQKTHAVEFVTCVNASKHILDSVNGNRRGQLFNPLVRSTPPVYTSIVHTV
jgi:hypothetical protein